MESIPIVIIWAFRFWQTFLASPMNDSTPTPGTTSNQIDPCVCKLNLSMSMKNHTMPEASLAHDCCAMLFRHPENKYCHISKPLKMKHPLLNLQQLLHFRSKKHSISKHNMCIRFFLFFFHESHVWNYIIHICALCHLHKITHIFISCISVETRARTTALKENT